MSMFEITALLWRRRYIVIALAGGLVVLGTAFVVLGRSTTYTADSRVLVDQPALVGNTGGGSVPGKLASLAPTFCLFLEGDDAVRAIADEAGVTPARAAALAGCTPVEGTTVLRVAATSERAEEARAVAAAAASYLADEISTRYAGEDVPRREHIEGEVLVSADLPAPDPDDTARQLTLVVVLALLVAAGFAVAAEPHRADALPHAATTPVNGHRASVPSGAP